MTAAVVTLYLVGIQANKGPKKQCCIFQEQDAQVTRDAGKESGLDGLSESGGIRCVNVVSFFAQTKICTAHCRQAHVNNNKMVDCFCLKRSVLSRSSLQVERLSKSVVAKRAELQNLEAESSAKQARSTEY